MFGLMRTASIPSSRRAFMAWDPLIELDGLADGEAAGANHDYLRTSVRGSFGRTLAEIRRAISEGPGLRTRSPSFGPKSPTEGAAIAQATAVGTGRRRVAVR